MSDRDPQYVTASTICRRWPVLFPDTARLYRLAANGTVPHVRVGRKVYFDLDRVAQWVADGGGTLPGGWRLEPTTTARR